MGGMSGKVQIFFGHVSCADHLHELARFVVSKPLEELVEDTLDPADPASGSPQAGQMAGYTHGVPVGTLA